MKAKKAKAKAPVKTKAKRKSEATAEDLMDMNVGNGVMIETGNTKKEMDSTYRAIRSWVLSRKGEKYRIIKLLKSFLLYRLK
jgi:hypothetical protein